ncbi:MAG TPA: Fic family protein [Kineosporiaceae bacterium]|nr:Fic family protein [Kineosporiaceae bacterium]
MSALRPWEVGDARQRWEGYLDPAHRDPVERQNVLRNLVAATTYGELREREDAAVGMRAMTLRAHNLPGTYDLDGLRSIHRHLFQDVYAWAGDVRTVNISKGGAPFASTDQIEPLMQHVSTVLQSRDLLREVPEAEFPDLLARVYYVVNMAHPFREGNGRTQREFITALAGESGHSIDWTRVHGHVNDAASRRAREGDLEPLKSMFRDIVTSGQAGGRVVPETVRTSPREQALKAARQVRDQAFPLPARSAAIHPPSHPVTPRPSAPEVDRSYSR